jgi:hypothetical protein
MKILNEKRKVLLVVIPILIILFPLGYSVADFLFSKDTQRSRPFLQMPDAKYRQCVRETSYMRFHHMDLLKAIRDETVREGKAGEITLENCQGCHTNRERFCNQCHNAVNLNLDCFGCHYYPLKAQMNAQRSGDESRGS